MIMIKALSDADIEILTAFAENDMNVTKTAKRQYRCRGSIIYHLNKVKECTGLNPLKFYDLVRLLELCGKSEGEWIGVWDYVCSVCYECNDFKTDFCPNCGAKMKGERDEQRAD